MAIPKKKKKSLLKKNTSMDMANITSGDIRSMAGDSSFRSWRKKKDIEVDSLDSKKMYEMYMKYLEETGQ